MGGEVFKNGGGGILQNLMLEGGPEAPFTSPSAISYSHMASALEEQSGRSACGRESGPRNLYSQSNANFQFNTLGKQERDHTDHSGQEGYDLSSIAVDSTVCSAAQCKCVHPVHEYIEFTQLKKCICMIGWKNEGSLK